MELLIDEYLNEKDKKELKRYLYKHRYDIDIIENIYKKIKHETKKKNIIKLIDCIFNEIGKPFNFEDIYYYFLIPL
jgi:hypothetical protein